jgi:hypothetical protein
MTEMLFQSMAEMIAEAAAGIATERGCRFVAVE